MQRWVYGAESVDWLNNSEENVYFFFFFLKSLVCLLIYLFFKDPILDL